MAKKIQDKIQVVMKYLYGTWNYVFDRGIYTGDAMMKLFREESELPNQEWVLRLSVGGIIFLKNDWAWLILDVPRPHGDSSMVVIVYIYCMDMYGSTYKQMIAEKEEAG